MSKKTRMSGVIDHSSMGLNLGTEMELSQGGHASLRRALYKASEAGMSAFPHLSFKLISGHKTKGNATYLLEFPKPNSDDGAPVSNHIRYDFKQQGSNYFINVSGNPTCLVTGGNDLPVLIRGHSYNNYNAATITFTYLNRIMYAIFDTLLAEYGFAWAGVDKRRLVNGDIAIQSYQIAWYSGDLAEQRDAVFSFIRAVYGGLDATVDGVINVGKELGLIVRIWDNNDHNLSIEARSGTHRNFSLTLYAKDEEPNYSGSNSERLSKLIRWDCTLNNAFLQNNKIAKIADLEAKYIALCDADGYDVGFIRWISNKVQQKLQLPYMLGLSVEKYTRGLVELEDVRGKHTARLAQHWLRYGPGVADAPHVHFGMEKSRYSEAKSALFTLSGIDISIPRSTHEAILENRINATRSRRERGHNVAGRHNAAVSWSELVERDTAALARLCSKLDKADNLIRVRKFAPTKIKTEDFWVYTGKQVTGEAA